MIGSTMIERAQSAGYLNNLLLFDDGDWSGGDEWMDRMRPD